MNQSRCNNPRPDDGRTGMCCRIGNPPRYGCAPRYGEPEMRDTDCHAQSRDERNEHKKSCCGTLSGLPLAMAYIQDQTFCDLYAPEDALCSGTIFRALDLPFCGDTISDNAYPKPPARTCGRNSCGKSNACDMGCMKGGNQHG